MMHPLHPIKVWVLPCTPKPEIKTLITMISPRASRNSRRPLVSLTEWKWQVTISNYAEIIGSIVNGNGSGGKIGGVQLCDGDEINGMPGTSVVRLLKEKQLISPAR
jgi:D-alanine-D-alanine ligase